MSIEALEIEFDTNQVIMIHGDNGSGKTAMMSAIALALLNYRKGDSYKDFIKTGCETARVVLDVLYRGDPMHIDILISNDKYSTPLTRKIAFKDTIYNNSECTAFLHSLDVGYLEHVMFFFQKDNSIVDLKSGERAKLLKKLFHFEFEEQLADLRSRLDAEQSRLQSSSVRLEEASKRVFNTTPLLEIPELPEDFQKQLEEVTAVIAAGEAYDGEALELVNTKLATANSKLTACRNAISSHSADIVAKKQAIVSFEKLIRPVPAPIPNEFIAKLEAGEKALNESLLAQKLQSNKVSQLKSQLEISLTGVCHACGNTIDEHHVSSLKDELTAASKKLSLIEETFQQKEEELNALRSEHITLKMEEKRSAEAVAAYEKQETAALSYKSAIKQSEELLRILDTELHSLEKEIAHLEKEQKANAAALEAVELAHEAEEKYAALRTMLEKKTHAEIVNTERQRNNKLIKEEALKHELEKQSLAAVIEEASRNVDVLKASINILDSEFPNFIILRTCSHVENYINSFVSKIFPYMKVKLSQNRGGVDFYYTANSSDDEWLSVKMASGAEAAILSLAWRVAIAKLYGVTTLLLDEVDAEATDENSKYIYEFISTLTVFNQLLLISHRKEALRTVAALADNVTCYEVEHGVYTLVSDPDFLE